MMTGRHSLAPRHLCREACPVPPLAHILPAQFHPHCNMSDRPEKESAAMNDDLTSVLPSSFAALLSRLTLLPMQERFVYDGEPFSFYAGDMGRLDADARAGA